MDARKRSNSSTNSNRNGSKTLEELLIDRILIEAQTVQADLAQVLAVVLLQNGAASEPFKYVDEHLKRVTKHVENSTRALHNIRNLIGETAIVGNLSNSEMKYRCSVLIERLGIEEVMKLINQIESDRPLPENVVSFSKYKLKKEKTQILGTNQPKGAA